MNRNDVYIPRAGMGDGGIGAYGDGRGNPPNNYNGGRYRGEASSVFSDQFLSNRHAIRITVLCCRNVSCLTITKVFVAELIATAILLFVGCSGMWFMPVTFGVAIAIATQIFGDISGAHINPAVTLAAAIMGRIESLLLVPFYFVAQVLGGFAGYGLHYAILTLRTNPIFEMSCVPTANSIDDTYGVGNVGNLFGFELLMSFIYIMALCALWEHDRRVGDSNLPLKRGLFYTGIVMCWYYVLGRPLSLNPIRAIIPLIINSDYDLDALWDIHWVYWVGPLVGSFAGAVFYKIMNAIHQQTKHKD